MLLLELEPLCLHEIVLLAEGRAGLVILRDQRRLRDLVPVEHDADADFLVLARERGRFDLLLQRPELLYRLLVRGALLRELAIQSLVRLVDADEVLLKGFQIRDGLDAELCRL